MSKRQLIVALALIVLLGIAVSGIKTWSAYAQGPTGNNPPCGDHVSGRMGGQGMGSMMHGGYRSGHGMGMMGGSTVEDCPWAEDWESGMMGNMMGWMHDGGWSDSDHAMMDSWVPPQELVPTTGTLTQEDATKIAEAYLATLKDDNLALGDVVEFHSYFHAVVVEKDSGHSAFGLMIDPATGQVWFHHQQGVTN